jgi:hypothetical protein
MAPAHGSMPGPPNADRFGPPPLPGTAHQGAAPRRGRSGNRRAASGARRNGPATMDKPSPSALQGPDRPAERPDPPLMTLSRSVGHALQIEQRSPRADRSPIGTTIRSSLLCSEQIHAFRLPSLPAIRSSTTWAVFDLVAVEICVGNAGSRLVRDAQRTVAS